MSDADAEEIGRIVSEGIRLARSVERLLAISEALSNLVHQLTDFRTSGLIGDDLDPELSAVLEGLVKVEDGLTSAGRVLDARLQLLIQ